MNNTKFLQAIKKQNQIIWLESLAQSSSISQILYSRFKFKNKYTKFNKESGICTQIKGKPRWLITKSKGLILNAEVIVLNLSLKMTHEVLVPHKLIRAQKVLFTSPILSKLQCGRWATIVAQSQLQWTIWGASSWAGWLCGLSWVQHRCGWSVLIDGCGCRGHWDVAQNHHCSWQR